MANKYIIHGATHCGDGTSSTQAASAGATGAWNAINIFEGTTPPYGALGAGDTVFIRSKDASGADITANFTGAVNLGSAAATEFTPITWVIDAGSVWPGVTGVVTYDVNAQATSTLRDYNNIHATDHNFIFKNSYTWFGSVESFSFGKCLTHSVKLDFSAHINNSGAQNSLATGTHIDMWAILSNIQHFAFAAQARAACVDLHNPRIELLNATAVATRAVFGNWWGYGSGITVYGGEITGPGAQGATYLATIIGTTRPLNCFGLSYPRDMPLLASNAEDGSVVNTVGCDAGLGASYADYRYSYDSRNITNYYPTLNATLPTGEPWSYKLYPYRVGGHTPARLTVSKVYAQADAQKTVTLELLWPTTLATPDTTTCYITLQYTNAAGAKVAQTTHSADAVALATSAALWSATSYGPTPFTRYKVAIQTSEAIQQNTDVLVSLFVAKRAATANDIIFVCPDPTFT